MLIADYKKEVSPTGVRLVIEASLLEGEPVVELTRLNSGAALVLSWQDDAIVLTRLDSETVIMLTLAFADVMIYEADTQRELKPKPVILSHYNQLLCETYGWHAHAAKKS